MRLHIEKLVFGGLGLARTKDGVVFVEQVLPDEIVDACIIGKKGGVSLLSPVKIIEKSPHRRDPVCPHFGICGGCDWQYIDYSYQLVLKKEIYLDCLLRIGKVNNIPDIEIFESPEWNYRIRAQLKIDRMKSSIGFFRSKTNDVVSIKECHLLDPAINQLLENQTSILSILQKDARQIKLIVGTNGAVASFPEIKEFSTKETEILVDKAQFIVSGSSFFQGNRFLHKQLGVWAKPHIAGDFLIDMYGGQGFFSVMIGDKFKKGLLIESQSYQVEKARDNFRKNNLSHMEAESVSAEHFFKTSYKSYPMPDCLIIDPPRPGLTIKVRKGIEGLSPKTILYISCNPSTQARDVGFFINRCNYTIKRAAIFDLYPQTHHLETGMLLEKDL